MIEIFFHYGMAVRISSNWDVFVVEGYRYRRSHLGIVYDGKA